MAEEALRFHNTQGSLLQEGSAATALVSLLRDLNESTWFVVDGSEQVVQTTRGARPSEAIADLMFVFPC